MKRAANISMLRHGCLLATALEVRLKDKTCTLRFRQLSDAPPAPDRPLSATVPVINRRGLHARASARFCAVASAFDAKIRVTKDQITVGGQSIMGLLMLGAGVGSTVTISATGPQAAEALDTLVKLIADKFGEGE